MLLGILLINYQILLSQNFDKLNKKEAISVSGGINQTMMVSHAKINTSRDPFRIITNGNISLNILDINLPFTFSLMNKSIGYSLPFNQVRFSPNYKWIKVHIGNLNTSLSKFTISGVNTNGIELELNPGKWKINIAKGRIGRTAHEEINLFTRLNTYAVLNSFAIQNTNADFSFKFSLLYGRDRISKLSDDIYTDSDQNLALSFEYEFPIGKKSRIEIIQGFSFYKEPLIVENNQLDLFNLNDGSIRFDKALHIKFKSRINKIDFAFDIEHIDPEYKTIGTNYFQNNFQNISLKLGIRHSKKCQSQIGLGLQRNNLNKTQSIRNLKLVINYSLVYFPNKKITTQFSFSNFTSITNKNPIYESENLILSVDTLNFYQVQRSGNFVFSFKPSQHFRIAIMSNYSSSDQLESELYIFKSSKNNIQTFNSNFSLGIINKSKRWTYSILAGNIIVLNEFANSQSNYVGFKSDYKNNSGFQISANSTLNINNNSKNSSINNSFSVSTLFSVSKSKKQKIRVQSKSHLQYLIEKKSMDFQSSLVFSYQF